MNNTSSTSHTIDRASRPTQLQRLGSALAQYRVLVAKTSQKNFALMLGISKPTLIAIEQGSEGVSIGIWFRVFKMMNIQEELIALANDASLQIGVESEYSTEFLVELFNSDIREN